MGDVMLSDREVQKIVGDVAARLGRAGLVTAHRAQNRDAVLVVQVIGDPSYEFSIDTDATADEILEKAEDLLSRS
jgi:hypothetical protein